MNMPMPYDPFAHAILPVDDADLPIDEWTLDEVELAADLASLASAQARMYDQNE